MLCYNPFVPLLLYVEKFEFPSDVSIGKHVELLLKRNPNRDSEVASFVVRLFPSLELKPLENDFQQFLCTHVLSLSSCACSCSLSDTHTILALI